VPNFLGTWYVFNLHFLLLIHTPHKKIYIYIACYATIYIIARQVYIKATGEQSAEMVTDEGAIYVTSNRGYNWKAAVQETVSATLNRYRHVKQCNY